MARTDSHQIIVEIQRTRLEESCQTLGTHDGLNTVCIAAIGHEAGAHEFVRSHNLRGLDVDGRPVYRDR